MDSTEKESEKKENIEGLDETQGESWGDYPLDTVFVRKDQRTVGEIVSRIEKNRYKLDPEFQRDFVWSLTKQSRLIESSLMRIPLPVLYVAEDNDGKIIVVDGLQRLTTFHRYLNNKFALKDVGNSDPESLITGKKFDELPVHLQERIEDTQLTLYILDPKAPERARLDIFERVNSGEPLTRQQMRNCLYSGKSTRWLKDAAKLDCFLKATGGSLNVKTMRDREVINRFCSFYLLGYENYKGDMEEYLAAGLSKMNCLEDNELHNMMVYFEKAMDLIFELFGKHSFRKSMSKSTQYDSRSVLNISLFDAFATQLALNYEILTGLEYSLIKNRLSKLVDYKDFSSAVSYSTNNPSECKTRHRLAFKVLSAESDLSFEQIIYSDIIDEFFRLNGIINSEKISSSVSVALVDSISNVKNYPDWSFRNEIISGIEFNLSVALEEVSVPEIKKKFLIDRLVSQALDFNM